MEMHAGSSITEYKSQKGHLAMSATCDRHFGHAAFVFTNLPH